MRSLQQLALGLFCATLVSEGSCAATPAPSEKVTGLSAWRALAGNTIVGATPDGPYAEYFAENGTVRHVDHEGKMSGRWVFRDPLLCTAYPEDTDDDECMTPEVEGTGGALIDRGGTRYPFTILPGNAKGL